MNRHDTLDAERIANINQRIRETFDFARDVIADPAILEEIPDGAEIDLRTLFVDEQSYRVVTFRSESDPVRWVALASAQTSGDQARGRNGCVSIRRESAVSAEAAIDAAESALRSAAESAPAANRIA